MLELIILNPAYNPALVSPEALLADYFSLTGWAEGVAAAGARVSVVQRFSQDAIIRRAGVTYYLVADRYGPSLTGRQHPGAWYRRIWSLVESARRSGHPTVVHLNSLIYPLQARLLRMMLPRRVPLVVQHHAELMWPANRRWLQAWALAGVDGFLFATTTLAREWVEAGVLGSMTRVYQVMETSSLLTYQDRAVARAQTGLTGEPILLWTGNLSLRKDPLTVLAGFEQVLDHLPGARLYMAYLEDELLAEVQARLNASERLHRAVTLLGRLDYEAIAAYYNSADIFVQGSHRESSGIALLDALACGVVPVVTDVPSFRLMTDNGTIGALWPAGQATALAEALLSVARQPLEPVVHGARAFFQDNWSFAAIGRRAGEVYHQVWKLRNF
ncbi:MAG TPA: glycosyltransferase family 4 protein [Anaerolineae bacterium]|nr:glycosyltransferase family 4 protein [Anaerolineae bacterium]